MSISEISSKISFILKDELSLDEDKREVVEYSLNVVMSITIGLFFVIIVSMFLGVLETTLTITIAAGILRVFAGGAHCSTPFKCNFFGSIFFPSLGLLTYYVSQNVSNIYFMLFASFISLLISLSSFMKYSPADTPAKPISNKKKTGLRRISVTIVILYFALAVLLIFFKLDPEYILSIIIGMTWQAFIITPTGYRFLNKVDYGLTWLSLFYRKTKDKGGVF
ncbi:MAG: accessory regulator [Thermosediminibacterales bacterium]|nr:accessory regulator [Thermosediminibacterales bacterium]MDK2836183.1 accessory regulator [Thermosediminibacterales bacterium]